jgi:DNA-binding LacI/PurR family transcriptional regulator
MDPALTVVAQPTEEMGKCAMELLLARLRSAQAPQTRIFAPELIVRRSSAPLRS